MAIAALWIVAPCASQPPPGFIDASLQGPGFDSVDATAALQAAIDTGSDVWVPNMGTDWNITPIVLTQSNQTILFEEGVVVAAKQGAYLGLTDFMFRSQLKDNVRLEGYGATFRFSNRLRNGPVRPRTESAVGAPARTMVAVIPRLRRCSCTFSTLKTAISRFPRS